MFRTVYSNGQVAKINTKLPSWRDSSGAFRNARTSLSNDFFKEHHPKFFYNASYNTSQTSLIGDKYACNQVNQGMFSTAKNDENKRLEQRFIPASFNIFKSFISNQKLKEAMDTTDQLSSDEKSILDLKTSITDLKALVATEIDSLKQLIEQNAITNYKQYSHQIDQREQVILTLRRIQELLRSNSQAEVDNLVELKTTVQKELKTIAGIDSEELDKLRKLNEASESRLSTGAAYATILSLLVAVIIFLYQKFESDQKEEAIKEKEREQRELRIQKLQLKEEEVQKQIKHLQIQYASLRCESDELENKINFLKAQKAELEVDLKNCYWFNKGAFQIEISRKETEIESYMSQLRKVQHQLKILLLLTSNQKDLEVDYNAQQKELHAQNDATQTAQPDYEPVSRNSFGR